MKMQSGEHKGREISSLPTEYLKWMMENWSESTMQDRLIREAAKLELEKRDTNAT